MTARQRLDKLVVTGASSFIGAHLAKHFSNEGFDVVCTISGNLNNYGPLRRARIEAAFSAGCQVAEVDLGNPSNLRRFINSTKPDYWIHHAGWAQNYHSLEYDLAKGHAINIAPLDTLYPALKEIGCRGIILTGSSAEYGQSEKGASENDICEPQMPYGLSKLAQTLRAKQLASQYEMRTRVARVFIPFGVLDAPDKLLPSVISALQEQRPISLTPCTQQRDFVYVGDLVAGYRELVTDLSRDALFDIFNLCSGAPTSLKDFLLVIANLMSAPADLLVFGAKEMREGEALVTYGLTDKARKILGWEPKDLRLGVNAFLLETAGNH